MGRKNLNMETLTRVLDEHLKNAVSDTTLPFAMTYLTDSQGDLYKGYHGTRDIAGGTDVEEDSVVLIASATKAVTAVAALQLVEKGKMDLDAPASTYAPEIAKLQVLHGWNDDGSPDMRDPKTPITLRHLLTHTSGLGYEIWSHDILKYMEYANVPGFVTLEKASLFTPLHHEPGEKWTYGISLDWVGILIEEVSGQGLEGYIRDNIFKPLGMNDSAFKLPQNMIDRIAKIHFRNDDGQLESMDFIAEQNGDFEEGGGGIYCSLGDYTRFMRMILNDGKYDGGQILGAEMMTLLKENATGDLPITKLETAIPSDSNDAEFFPGLDKCWTLGFMRNNETAPTGRTAGSLAWAGLFNTYYWIDLEKDVAGIFTTQLAPFADEKSLDCFFGFEKHVYDALQSE